MAHYVYAKMIDSTKLESQIATAGLSGLVRIDTVGTTVLIYFEEALSAEQKTALDGVITSHQTVTLDEVIMKRIAQARAFGTNIMMEYAVRNVKAGKSIEAIKHILEKTQFIQSCLMTGSLYVALQEMQEIEPDAHLTAEDKAYFVDKLTQYLGM